jgi:undecaprenyl-diphosphatase
VSRSKPREVLDDLRRLDVATYTAIADTSTPSLDRVLGGLSRAADYSRLSIASATALAIGGGPQGRRAAVRGLAAVAVTAATINLVVKPILRRRRPDQAEIRPSRQIKLHDSHSFPSGHSAAAFAFAAGAGRALPWTTPPLSALAALVAYSRVHTGVHYPLDVIVGALCGVSLAALSDRMLDFISLG